jgi:hypothetical protein
MTSVPDPPADAPSFLFAAEAELEGGWRLGWAVDEAGNRWPVVFDTHIGGGPILLGAALDRVAQHDALS